MTAKADLMTRARPVGPFWLAVLAGAVGVASGLGAVVFRGLIAMVHNLLFLGEFSLTYPAVRHTPASPWGPWIILAPAVGAAAVVFLVKNFAPEARGRGVSEVMDAIYYHRGKIRPVVALVKSLASALTIGTGGSAGREGPIIQIGASFGSTAGQLLGVPAWQCIVLIAGGAGGGIAATFGTPIGGILFVQEIMLPEMSIRTLGPLAIATVTATTVGRFFFGASPPFAIHDSGGASSGVLLLPCAVLGVLAGLVSALFIKSVFGCEDFFARWSRGGYLWQHVAGMLGVGLIFYSLMVIRGNYYVEGLGYATVQDVLSNAGLSVPLLLALFALKMLATSLTLGSGASGGIFSPALYLGATLGGAYGTLLAGWFPDWGVNPAVFAAVGMAAVIAGATGAALAAVVTIFEMTRDYNFVVPMILAVALSHGVRKLLSRESIYTLKLARRGHYIPWRLTARPFKRASFL